jgi:serine/threonine protein kinase
LQPKGEAAVCPHCQYNEAISSPIALPCRTLLHAQYWIGRVLGMGGFGLTYLAWDTGLETPVAIKEYLPKAFARRNAGSLDVRAHSSEDQAHYDYGLHAFLREAKTLAKFDHPHIVKPRNVFEENNTAYIVMDYLEGETLQDYLERQPGQRLSPARALEILLPVLAGLEQVHAQGFIHRDIKPPNIFLTRFAYTQAERPILLDFGSARLALGERSQRSLVKMLTHGFAAPEQYHAQGQGPWTDIYGIAATLYYMTTGHSLQRASFRLLEDHLPKPRELAPELTESFSQALLQALSINPRQRPQTLAALRLALAPARRWDLSAWKAWFAKRPAPVPPPPRVADPNLTTPMLISETTAPQAAVPAPPPEKSWKAKGYSLIAALTALAAAGLWAFWQQ